MDDARRALSSRVPAGVSAFLFDLDGVLTDTAQVHADAWKEMFDDFLREHARETGTRFEPFVVASDYLPYVDGKERLAGVRSFLASRAIDLPEGTEDDPPDARTVHGLGRQKNDLVLELIREQGVVRYEGSVEFVTAARDAGIHRAVVSASRNCRDVLRSAGIEDLFEVRVDGEVAARDGLPGKPAPDTFVAAARAFGVEPAEAAVFEDALAGVEAGRAGDFGWVVGVDRVGQRDALLEHGADIVVADLSELLEAR
jgi:beta-phosphoglucomutase family hydrolase